MSLLKLALMRKISFPGKFGTSPSLFLPTRCSAERDSPPVIAAVGKISHMNSNFINCIFLYLGNVAR